MFGRFGRIFAASIVSIAMAASSVGAVVHAETVAALTATQSTTPTFTCATGIISTICSLVFDPICKDHCLSAPAVAGGSTQVTATRTGAAPSFTCSPIAAELRHGCYATAQQTSAAAVLPPGELCTINIRPINPFCLLP